MPTPMPTIGWGMGRTATATDGEDSGGVGGGSAMWHAVGKNTITLA